MLARAKYSSSFHFPVFIFNLCFAGAAKEWVRSAGLEEPPFIGLSLKRSSIERGIILNIHGLRLELGAKFGCEVVWFRLHVNLTRLRVHRGGLL